MYRDDLWDSADLNYDDENNVNNTFENVKRIDKGYNVIYRKAFKKDGKSYNKKIDIYTSSGTGNRIRDAETGEYLNYIVGSCDEDLFFKVMLVTGECRSKNGSNTLFYTSPQHYSSHLECKIDEQSISNWEEKRNARLSEIERSKSEKSVSVRVR